MQRRPHISAEVIRQTLYSELVYILTDVRDMTAATALKFAKFINLFISTLTI